MTRWVLLGAAAGFWAGALVGGISGRVAMFVLRLTSDRSLRGRTSDDGFEIGIVSGSTFFLIFFSGVAGVLAGIGYVSGRWALPPRARVATAAVVGALLGGATIVHDDGIDFHAVEPQLLSIAMFIAIPGFTTAAIAWTVEHWERWWFVDRRRRSALLAAPLVLPPTVVIVAGALVVAAPVLAVAGLSRRLRQVAARAWPAFGKAALAAMAGLSTWALVSDIVAIL